MQQVTRQVKTLNKTFLHPLQSQCFIIQSLISAPGKQIPGPHSGATNEAIWHRNMNLHVEIPLFVFKGLGSHCPVCCVRTDSFCQKKLWQVKVCGSVIN